MLDAASEFFEHCQRDLVQLLLPDWQGSARCVALAVATASGPRSFQTDLKRINATVKMTDKEAVDWMSYDLIKQ